MHTEKQLHTDCLNQKRSAQKLFHEKFYGSTFAMCMRYTKDREDADELSEKCFMYIFKNMSKKTSNESLKNFVNRVFLKIIINNITKNNTIYNLSNEHVDLKEKEDYVLESDFILKEVGAEEIINNLQKLSTVERYIFNLNIIDGISLSKAGKMLNLNKITSKSILQKAKLNLKNSLFESVKMECSGKSK